MKPQTKPLLELNYEQLCALLSEKYDEPAFRAKQLRSWLLKGRGFDEMRNIPLELRKKLHADYTPYPLEILHCEKEESTETLKYLFQTADHILVEAVALKYGDSYAVCVSSQAGCKMGCSFCASGKDGFIRNLSAYEMLSQPLLIGAVLNERVGRVVLMGSGEPLDNYERVKQFIYLCADPQTLNIGMRSITLSTCGITAGIERMSEDGLFVNLALSLHAPFHELRASMMPAENKYPLEDVMEALKKYRAVSGRRVSLEYCVIEGLNDTPACVRALKGLTQGTDMHVNLIGINKTGTAYGANTARVLLDFANKLKNLNINCTIRRKLGSSINAACGQLKSRYLRESDV